MRSRLYPRPMGGALAVGPGNYRATGSPDSPLWPRLRPPEGQDMVQGWVAEFTEYAVDSPMTARKRDLNKRDPKVSNAATPCSAPRPAWFKLWLSWGFVRRDPCLMATSPIDVHCGWLTLRERLWRYIALRTASGYLHNRQSGESIGPLPCCCCRGRIHGASSQSPHLPFDSG